MTNTGNSENSHSDEIEVLKNRISVLEKIPEISCKLSSSLRLDPLLNDIVTIAADIIQCAGTSIFLVDENTDDLRFKATTIKASQLVLDVLIPLNKSLAGEIYLYQKPLIVYDVQTDKRFFNEVDKILGFESKSIIGVPLIINEKCIGVIEAVNKKGDDLFTDEDVNTLTALAGHASIAIENARLYESVLSTANLLEHKVQERTVELKMRNQKLSSYDHTVAHYLKNLLSIISYSKIIEDDFHTVSETELFETLQSITNYAFKMSSALDELLYLAEVRDSDIITEPIDMGPIISKALKRVDFMAREYNAELEYRHPGPEQSATAHG